MDEPRIQEAIAFLDREVPREGARVRLDQYGGGPDESQLIANQTGYLRLGIELLKAAFRPTGERASVEVEIEDLVTSDSKIHFDWFERREPSESGTLPTQARSAFLPIATGIALLAVFLGLLGVGLITVVRWLIP